MHPTHRQLQVFLAVAEHRSVTAAARACHITQPTVSMQLKELSDSIGMPLYEQIGKQLHFTDAGTALAETARAMLDEWSRFEQTVDSMKGLTKGRLRVAVVTTAKYFIPEILGGFCERYSDIDIALQVLNRDGVLARLRSNADDLYIMSIPPTDMKVATHAFLSNPLVVIAPSSHTLAMKRKLPLDELAHVPFIMREPGSGTRLACDAHFAKTGFSPKIRLELGSNEAIKHSVAGNLGIGIVSRHALAANPKNESLTILPVQSFPVHSNWWVLYPQGKRLSPIAAAFLDHLTRTALELNKNVNT